MTKKLCVGSLSCCCIMLLGKDESNQSAYLRHYGEGYRSKSQMCEMISESWERAANVLQEKTGSNTNVQVLLKACSRTRNLEKAKQVHAEAVKHGYDSSLYVGIELINMYVKCGSMLAAREVFDNMKRPDVVVFNVLILGYANNGQGCTALDLFTRMRTEGLQPDSVTFVAAIKACTSLSMKEGALGRDKGNVIHNLAVEISCTNVYVHSTLIDMYAKFQNIVDARGVFDSMKHPDVVSWNGLILGYTDNGQGHTALDLFIKMRSEGLAPSSVTFLAVLKACTFFAFKGASGWLERGKAVHTLAMDNGCISLKVQNTLMDMYAKCGSVVSAREVFDSMKRPDIVSWNVLILGYTDNGECHIALDLFIRLRLEGPAPNFATFAAALKACGLIGLLELGRTIHSEIRDDLDVVLVNCLVDFYAKCGSLVEAQSVFDSHAARNIITWTALMAGFSSCGDTESVFTLFERMQEAGIIPNGVTFLCILTCCSHAGLVQKGKECFDMMCLKYCIVPTVEHYNCMVDIFGRANKLDDAMALLNSMPCSPNDVTLITILSACRKCKNSEIPRLLEDRFVNMHHLASHCC